MIAQFAIASTEVTAMLLLSSKDHRLRRYAAIFGLLGQPFWFYSTYSAKQYGAFFLCFIFAGIWLKLLYQDFLMDEKTKKQKLFLTNQQYYDGITDALRKIKTGEQPNLDHYDFIERALREALLEKQTLLPGEVGH